MLMGCASSSNVAEDTAEGIPISRAQFENFALQMGGEETTQVWTYTRS